MTTKIPSEETLLASGVHFGHQKRRWNPKMAPYIYKEQAGVHIIDLYKTHAALKEACAFLSEAAKTGQIIFVGTKGQTKDIVTAAAKSCGALFVTERWLGGTLTNFSELSKRLRNLKDYYQKTASGGFNNYTKKERLLMSREATKAEKVLGGILEFSGKPAAVVIVDPHREKNALSECQRLGIKIVALADTNCDPTGIDYLIPGNDDAMLAVEVIVGALATAIAGAGVEAVPEVEKVKPEVEKVKPEVEKVKKVKKVKKAKK